MREVKYSLHFSRKPRLIKSVVTQQAYKLRSRHAVYMYVRVGSLFWVAIRAADLQQHCLVLFS